MSGNKGDSEVTTPVADFVKHLEYDFHHNYAK
jgi:hypothetical protein